MKRFAFATIVLLGLTISCAPTATPQLQVALATATVQIPTVKPTLTKTPTSTPTITSWPTSTPTSTNTPTSARTSTPTITLTPTQTPIPKFVWKSGFENGFADWDGGGAGQQQGGTTEIIVDPTESGRGHVVRSVANVGKKPPVEEQPSWIVHRLYPFAKIPFKPAPCEIRQDVWISKDLLDTGTQGQNFFVVGPDVFGRIPEDGGDWDSAVQAVIEKSLFGNKVYLRLKFITSRNFLASLDPDAPEFTSEHWHTVSIFIEPNRTVDLFQDGRLVSRGTLPTEKRLGTVGGHPGLYAWQYKTSPPFKGMLLVDNFEIRCW